jgi:spore coat polysaccharide biosynthesis protein SpsF
MDIGGATVLERVVNRLRRARRIHEVVIATTALPVDRAIVAECERLGVNWFPGSENDVLDRYYHAAQARGADVIVRITSDCPLIDGTLVDETIQVFRSGNADYANNVAPRTYPRGLDCEVFTAAALERAWRESSAPYEREHVTPYFYQHPEIFRLVSSCGQVDHSVYRWTLDTPEDLTLIREIYSHFDNRDDFSWREVIALMEREPELAEINAGVLQKPVHGD